MSEHDHDPAKRVAAFDAVVSLALEEAQSDGATYWGRDVDRSEVERRVRRESDVQVSTRTVDRALKDAASLGWLKDRRKGWDIGPRAEEWTRAEQDENPV
jgi:predicted NodU family carbamoyl transferase